MLSLFSAPISITFSEIGFFEGKQVIMEGIVTNHYVTDYGNQIVTLQSNNESSCKEICLFLETQASIEYGDLIEATGRIQKYEDTWELIVSHPQFINVISSWQNQTCPLWQLAQYPKKYLGRNIKVYGIIERCYESYCFLIDTSAKYTLAIYFNPQHRQNFSEGTLDYFQGRFVYDQDTLRYILDTREIKTKLT